MAFCGGVGFGFVFATQEVEAGFIGSGKFGRFGKFLNRNGSRHFGEQLNAAVVFEAGAGRNEPAHDDVFLEATEVVNLASNSGFGEYASGLLEAGRRDKGIGRQRGLGDAEEQRATRSGTATFGDDAIVFFTEAELVDLLLEKEGSVADVFDLDPTHHLTRDGLDVLVVDVDTLQAINLLNGVDEVSLGIFFAEDREQVVKVERPVDEGFTSANVFAFLNVDVDAARDGVFLGSLAIFAFDVDLAHTLGNFAVANSAIDFGNDGRILGLAGFEEFNNARETTGDVLGLGGLARNLREHVSSLYFIAILDHQVSTGRHEVLLADLTGRIADQDSRLMLFVAGRQGNDELRQTGNFIDLLFNGEAWTKIVELHRAGSFGKDGESERIPFGKDLAMVYGFAIDNAEASAVDDVVAFFLALLFIEDDDETGTIHSDASTAATFDMAQVNESDDAIVLGFESGTLADAGRRTTDVESTHGELRAGFADGLSGDDADRFAEFDHAARGEIAAIAQGANTATRFAGEHGTNANAFDTGSLNLIGELFGDFLVDFDDNSAFEILDAFQRNTANNAVAKRFDFDTSFDDGLDEDAVGGTAIALVDDDVLRHVDETASEVTGIGSL